MSYKPQRKVYELEFVDYPGLEVTARSAPLGELSAAYDLNIKLNEPDKDKRLESFKFFADRLVSWNLAHPEVIKTSDNKNYPACAACGLNEDDDMPPTVDSMMCLEVDIIMAIIFGWVNTIAKVSVPKGMNSSNGGGTIPEEAMKLLEQIQNPMPLPTLS